VPIVVLAAVGIVLLEELPLVRAALAGIGFLGLMIVQVWAGGSIAATEAPQPQRVDLMEALIKAAPHPLVITDVETRTILRVNDQACRMFQREREQLEGRPTKVLVPEWRMAGYEQAVGQLLRERRMEMREAPAVAGDGSILWLDWSAYLIDDDGRELAVIVLTDMTERRAMEEAVA
jgi:PAS domain S-box-containing protein